jgi:hypothetical protein
VEAICHQKESPLAIDEFDIASLGSIAMGNGGVSRVDNPGSIGQLLSEQNHFNDVDQSKICNIINRHTVCAAQTGIPLPRNAMMERVEDRGLKCPTPK